MKLIFLLLSISSIFGANLHKIASHKSRSLADVTTLDFVSAKNLIFNSDSKWQFDVTYSGSQLPKDKAYTIPILYKGSQSLASCSSHDDFILNCSPNEDTQTIKDRIQINNAQPEGATIKWNKLTSAADIPINTTLKFEDSFNLSTTYANSKYTWHFRIKIPEDVLPENGLVNVDIYSTWRETIEKIVASCKYQNSFLNCEFIHSKSSPFLVQISSTKMQGSIEWGNLEQNNIIPLFFPATNFWESYDLELIDGKWNYILKARASSITIGQISDVITLNTKLVKSNNEEKIYFTRCFSLNDGDHVLYNCTVFGEKQDSTDLVYVTNSKENDVSVDWLKVITTDQLLVRKAELSFVKVYGLQYLNNNWNFKIDVTDDSSLPNGAKVYVDILNAETEGNSAITCTFNEHVLTCDKLSMVSLTNLIRFQSEKNTGSVTWKNSKQKHIPIPFIYTMPLTKAFGAFYTDRWNFLLMSSYTNNAPRFSQIIIDIIQNGKETTATCELLTKGQSGNTNKLVFCVSDLPISEQSETDTITISNTKKLATVTWNGNITSKSSVEKISTTDIKEATLEFNDAYDMYYSKNKWFFTVHSYSSSQLSDPGIYKIDISVLKSGEETPIKSTATCLLYDPTGFNSYLRFLCSCDYDNQNEDDLIKIYYQGKEDTTGKIKWSKGVSEGGHPIVLNVKLAIVKADSLTTDGFATNWKFKVEFEKTDDTILPLNSKVVVDIDRGGYLANCTVESEKSLDCLADCDLTNPPNLVYYKSLKSSVEWTNENLDDYSILREATVELISVNYLYYEESKWHFTLSTFLGYSQVIVDILYNGKASTATCNGRDNHIILCDVDEETQSNTDLVILASKNKKTDKSTVIWTNVNEDMKIPLYRELTYVNSYDLELNSGWSFKVKVSDNDIPDKSFIIVDVELSKTLGNGGTKKMNSTANCEYESGNSRLVCAVVIERESDDPSLYTPSLLLTKNPKSISSVTKWNGIDTEQTLSIPQNAELEFYYANKTITENSQTVFYIEISTKIAEEAKFIVDILIGETPKTSNCVATSRTTLRCVITDDIGGNKVYISKEKPRGSSSTVTWKNLEENQYLFSTSLKFIHAYNFKMYNPTTHYRFTLIAEGDENLKNNIIYPVKLHRDVNTKMKSNIYEKVHIAQCKYNDGFFKCDVERVYPDRDTYYLDLTSSDDTVQWTNPGHYIIDETASYSYNNKSFYYCKYDKTNYKYSLELNSDIPNTDEETIMVMDLKINEKTSYGLCTFESSKVVVCHTPDMTKGVDTIMIPAITSTSNNGIGNIYWRNFENLQIYPSGYIIAEVSKIYDLQFTSDKWQFKILTADSLTLDDSKKLAIKINNVEGYALCSVESEDIKKLECSVEQDSQVNTQLIKLVKEYKTDPEYIRLIDLKPDGIPFVTQLEFESVSELKYSNKEWSFTLKAKNSQNLNIPSGSTFSIDITYGTDNTQELAFCTENSRSDNTLTLTCKPQKEISKDSLIKLSNSNTKSDYASLTWINPTSITQEIYQELDLTVDYVSMPVYNSGKYTFNMYFKDNGLPIGSKTKIDISYKNSNELAECVLKSGASSTFNYFECSLDVTTQSEDDSLLISAEKKNGYVTFINSNLNFETTLFFEKAYDLTFDTNNKWSFKIKLSASNLPEGQTISIAITIDGNSKIATCKLNSNILDCNIAETGTITNIIKIVNSDRNTFTWKDLPDDVELRLAYTIDSITGLYGGYNDGKYQFYLIHTPIDNTKNGAKVYLDILYNNSPDKADCEIETPFLKCTYINKQTLEKIKISKNAPYLGTVTFSTPLTDDKEIKPATFTLKYENKESSYSKGKFTFKLKGKLGQTLSYKIYENSYTEVEIFGYQTDKEFEGTTLIAPCLTNEIATTEESDVQVTCEIQIANNLNVKLNIDSNKMSGALKIETDEQDIELKAAGSDAKSNNGNYLLMNNLLLLALVLLI